MFPLLRLTAELQVNIFAHLSTFTDAVSLALTCRSLGTLYRSYPSPILRGIAESSIASYPDALRVARASCLGCNWSGTYFCHRTQRYPTPPTQSFITNLASEPATLGEVRTVLKLHILVKSWQSITQRLYDYSPIEDFHRGMYRFLLLGYLFAGAYIAPLAGPSRRPKRSTRTAILDPDGVCKYPIFAVLDPTRDYKLNGLFGGFIDWLLADGSARGVSGEFPSFLLWSDDRWYHPDRAITVVFDGEEHGALRELMLVLMALELHSWMFNEAARSYPAGPLGSAQEPQVELYILGNNMPTSHTVPKPGAFAYAVTWDREMAINPTDVLADLVGYPIVGDMDIFRLALQRFGLKVRDDDFDERVPLEWLLDGGVLGLSDPAEVVANMAANETSWAAGDMWETMSNGSWDSANGVEDTVVSGGDLGYYVLEVGHWGNDLKRFDYS